MNLPTHKLLTWAAFAACLLASFLPGGHGVLCQLTGEKVQAETLHVCHHPCPCSSHQQHEEGEGDREEPSCCGNHWDKPDLFPAIGNRGYNLRSAQMFEPAWLTPPTWFMPSVNRKIWRGEPPGNETDSSPPPFLASVVLLI